MDNDVTETYVKLISMSPCFEGFGMNDLRQLLSISSKAFWHSGEDIFLEGSAGRDMFIICSGKVGIWRKNAEKRLALASLSVGESFGEMSLVDGKKRSACAEAAVDTLALRISYERLHEVPAAAAILYRNIARALASRLNCANNVILFQAQSGADIPPVSTVGRGRRSVRNL